MGIVSIVRDIAEDQPRHVCLEAKAGAGAAVALAGLLGLGPATADARVATDGKPSSRPDAKPQPDSRPSATPDKPASAPARAPSAPPARTDASDGYAGMRERPSRSTRRTDKPVRPKPGSPLDRSPLEPVKIGSVPIGVQAPPPARSCLSPGYIPVDSYGNRIKKPHADPRERPEAKPGQPRAKLSDLVKPIKWWVGDPLHEPTDLVAIAPWGKAIKWGGKGYRAIRGGGRAGEGAADADRALPARAPDARPEDVVAPSAMGKGKRMPLPDRPIDPTKPPPNRIDPWKDTKETRPDVGEVVRRENDLYDRQTRGLKNSGDVEVLKIKVDKLMEVLEALNNAAK